MDQPGEGSGLVVPFRAIDEELYTDKQIPEDDLHRVFMSRIEEMDLFGGRLLIKWYNRTRLGIVGLNDVDMKKITPSVERSLRPALVKAQLVKTETWMDCYPGMPGEAFVSPPLRGYCAIRRDSTRLHIVRASKNPRQDSAFLFQPFNECSVSYLVGAAPNFFDNQIVPRQMENLRNHHQRSLEGMQLRSLHSQDFDAATTEVDFVENTSRDVLTEILHDLGQLLLGIGEQLLVHVWDVNESPFIHAQSLGWSAGMTDHVEGFQIEDPDWQQFMHETLLGASPLGFSLHPKFGGWFSYRYLITFPQLKYNIPRPKPLVFVPQEMRKFCLFQYNTLHEAGRWRDCCKGSVEGSCEQPRTYSAEAYLYFHTAGPLARKRYWHLKYREYCDSQNEQSSVKSWGRKRSCQLMPELDDVGDGKLDLA